MGCAGVCWYERESARVRKGMPPSLHFRTAPGHCVSLLNVLPVMVCVRAIVCACVRAGVKALTYHIGEECVVRALRYVRRGLCVSLCMRVCVDPSPSRVSASVPLLVAMRCSRLPCSDALKDRT